MRDKLEPLPLRAGDIRLMMGTEPAADAPRWCQDLMLFNSPPLPSRSLHRRMPVVLATIVAVVIGLSDQHLRLRHRRLPFRGLR
ncbi:MAG: hypothetical protein EXS40_03440 [Opitutaceae bacterium]|nr:hypothetical protein [Opitutaceae bacterium]